ncbi:3-isopropylmalate dehydratase small subunit [Candidatus Blochmannia ocreatus (nom. nud.)]
MQHTGVVLPLNIANIDTDNIIPKQFLQEITRINFGRYLFFDWRFTDKIGKTLNSNFILNNPIYKNSSILLTQKNFGCGSSREHAVWALKDYGFKVIIAPSFSDIFYKNSLINNLFPIILSEIIVNNLFIDIFKKQKAQTFTINLSETTIVTEKTQYFFKINNFYKYYFNTLDSIDVTLQHDSEITKYENNQLSYLK